MTSKPFFKAPRRKRESEPRSEEATHGRGKRDGRGTVGRVSKSETPACGAELPGNVDMIAESAFTPVLESVTPLPACKGGI